MSEKRIDAESAHALDDSAGMLYPIQFIQLGTLKGVPTPLARITTCGSFRLDVLHELLPTDPPQGRYREITLENRPKSSSTALTLLKLLASQPGHAVARDWLSEQLGRTKSTEEDEEESWEGGMVRVDNIVGLLRGLLCPNWITEHDRRPLRKLVVSLLRNHHESGTGYQLGGEPLIWLDIDELAASVKLACLREERGKDALACWEQAYELAARGPFLPTEPYSDWAADKRAEIDGYLRQSVHRLRHLLLLRYGPASEPRVIFLLRQYWHTHLTDEEALRHLMELLSKHGGLHEAQQYYQRLCEHLQQEGDKPDQRTKEVAQNLVRFAQHREHDSAHIIETSSHRHPVALSLSQSDETQAPFSWGIIQDIIKMTIHELEGADDLKFSAIMHRRAVLAHLFGIPPAALATDKYITDTVSDTMKLQEEALSSLYEDMLIVGWDSFRRSKSPQIIIKIDEHVNKLNALAHAASSIRDAAHWQSLLCRFSQLSTRIAQHRLNEPRALSMAKQAIMIAIDLDNTELIASTFYGRGRAYMEYSNTTTDIRQKKRYFERAKADIDAALGYVERVRAPLAGNIYLLAAEIYALIASNDMVLRMQCERWQDQVAALVDSDMIEDDGTFLKLNPTALHHERAKTLLRFGKIEEARNELNIAWKTLQPNLFTWHMNMHLTQAALFLTEHDIEESAKASLKAHALAKAIHSHKGGVEVQHLLRHLQQHGNANSSVRELAMVIKGDA